MSSMIILSLLLLACLTHRVIAEERCPDGCSCTRCVPLGPLSNGTAMRCGLKGLKGIRDKTHIENMCTLNLTSSGITDFKHLAHGNFSRLLNLSMSHNQIQEVPGKTFSNFSNLEILNLDHNEISIIRPGGFEGLAKLKQLFLNHNELTSMASGAFRGLCSLTYLGLRHNKLNSWDGTFYEEMLNLIHLDIRGNDKFRFALMALPTSEAALQKIYGLNWISKKCKACVELTRANVSRKKVLPRRVCQYTPTEYLPMLDEYQARGVLLKGKCGTTQCELMLTDVDPLRKIYKDKCWAAIRKLRAIEYCLGLLAMIINLIVIVATLASKTLRCKTSFLLVCHLACCDLLMGFFFVMIASTGHAIEHDPAFRRWRVNECPYYRTVFVLSQTMGAATSLLVTIERYLAIVYSMKPSLRMTPTIAVVFLGCSWVFSAIMATLLQVFDNSLVRDNAMCVLAQNLSNIAGRSGQKLLYNQGLMLSLVFLYFVVIGLYVHLFLVVKKAAANAGIRREGKLAKRIGVIVISNLFLFVVPNLAIVVFTAAMVDISLEKPILNSIVRLWLPPVCMVINACMNPVLFAFRNEYFVGALKALVRGRQTRVAPAARVHVKITKSDNGEPSYGLTRFTPSVSTEMMTTKASKATTCGRTERLTDRRIDGLTDGRNDGQTEMN